RRAGQPREGGRLGRVGHPRSAHSLVASGSSRIDGTPSRARTRSVQKRLPRDVFARSSDRGDRSSGGRCMTEHTPRLQTKVLGVALAALIGWVLYVARDVLVPVAYSTLLVYVVLGMTRQMARIPRLGPRLPSALRYGVSAAVILAAVWGLTR